MPVICLRSHLINLFLQKLPSVECSLSLYAGAFLHLPHGVMGVLDLNLLPIHHGADEFEGHAIDLEFWSTIDLRSHNTLLPSIGCWAGGNYDALPLRNGAGGGGGYSGAEEVGKR